MTLAFSLSALAGVVALIAGYFYFFGIDPETKRKLENKALETMGENKMSYMAKDTLNRIPTSDQENVKQLKKSLGNAVGGISQNPLGEQVVRAATQVWDTATMYSKSAADGALKRVSTMTGQTADTTERTVQKKTE